MYQPIYTKQFNKYMQVTTLSLEKDNSLIQKKSQYISEANQNKAWVW